MGYCSSPPAIIEEMIMIQVIDDLITDIYDEHPHPLIVCNTADDYTARLVSQLNQKRTTRINQSPTRSPACSRPTQQETQL